MAISKTQIVNRAMIKLGARTVTNIDTDNTPESNAALNVYDMALETVLCAKLWTFATRRVLLAQTVTSIPFSRSHESLLYSYQMPVDALKIFETNSIAAQWQVEGDQILSDTDGLGVRYVYRNLVTATYPPYFVEALSDKLASDLAFTILNSRSVDEIMNRRYYQVSLPAALSSDSQIGTPTPVNANYWINARLGGAEIQELQ